MHERSILTDENGMEKESPMSGDFDSWFSNWQLSDYWGKQISAHWHQELEFIIVNDGHMQCNVNGNCLKIGKGFGIFINENTIHGYSGISTDDCSYFALRISPSLLVNNLRLMDKYVNPVLCCSSFPYLILDPADALHCHILDGLQVISMAYRYKASGYELNILGNLTILWQYIYQAAASYIDNIQTISSDVERLRLALSYIQKSYASPVSLNDISDACHCSKSTCNRLFQKSFNQTPVAYLLNYRIQQSLSLLMEGTLTITKISELVGFTSSSHFTETFRSYIGLTPTEYRKRKL